MSDNFVIKSFTLEEFLSVTLGNDQSKNNSIAKKTNSSFNFTNILSYQQESEKKPQKKTSTNTFHKNTSTNIQGGSNHLNIKIKNLGEVMTKVIKDGVLSTTNKFISSNESNNFGNLFSSNKKASTNLINSNSNQAHKSNNNNSSLNNSGNFTNINNNDLIQFFQDNQLNLSNFGEFFTFYNNNFLKNDYSKMTYSFLLAKGSKSISISRDPILNFDINLVNIRK